MNQPDNNTAEQLYNAQALLRKISSDFPINDVNNDSQFAIEVRQFKQNIFEKALAKADGKDYNYFKDLYIADKLPLYNEQMNFNSSTVSNANKHTLERVDSVMVQEHLFSRYQTYINSLPMQWTNFLNCAVGLYKHKFANQVMIFGQMPTATMVADVHVWNRANRNVIFNQPPIISIAQKQNILMEKRLYDISQTNGEPVTAVDFRLVQGERDILKDSLIKKYNLNATTFQGAIENIVGSLVLSELTNKEHYKLIYNSVMYILAKKLGMSKNDYATSRLIVPTESKKIILVGEFVQRTTRKVCDELQKQIIKLRSFNDEREDYNQRNRIHSGWGEPVPTSKRDNLRPIDITRGNAHYGANVRDSTARGQLSFGQIRDNHQEIYGGQSREPVVGVDDGRNSNAQTSPERGGVSKYETNLGGEFRETFSSSTHRRYPSSDQTLGVDIQSGGGNDKRGTIQGNISSLSTPRTSFHPQERFEDNVAAIKLLKQLETDNRTPTIDEQLTLKKYVGWGGLSKVFSEGNINYQELKDLLTEGEYSAARESTLTAFYTEPQIINAIYQGLQNLGLSNGMKVLDPAVGIGNFFCGIPLNLALNVTGVELDQLSGRIARKLYYNSDIHIEGYQETKFQGSPFNVAVGNVPFGEYKISNVKHNLLIHDFFFAKAIDDVIPGGVVAFITSKGTLDKSNPAFRKYLASKAELIGAVRLPDTAFKGIAGTEVTTDIIFLRKLKRRNTIEPIWVHVGKNTDGIPINQYFIDNPQNLMGTMKLEGSQFGQSAVLKPFETYDLFIEVSRAIDEFTRDSGQIPHQAAQLINKKPDNEVTADPSVKNYTYTKVNDDIYFRINDTMELYGGKDGEKISQLHEIRIAMRKVIEIQSTGHYSTDKLTAAQLELSTKYDMFTSNYGYISDKGNKKCFEGDSDLPLLLSLENITSGGVISKAKLFTQATINPTVVFMPETYGDLITLSMQTHGKIDIDFMAKEFNVTADDIKSNLIGQIYLNPSTKLYEPSDKYLSGNVKEKLDIAAQAANGQSQYDINVQALKSVQPEPLTADQIKARLGSNFVDIKYYKQFMYELSDTPFWLKQNTLVAEESNNKISLVYNEFSSEYTIYKKGLLSNVKTNSIYGTDRKSFFEILEDSLNLRDVKVYDKKIVDDKEKSVLNVKETAVARQKQELIRHEFIDWLFKDPERINDVIKTYNERFNVYRPQVFDGSKLAFFNMSNEILLREHQKNAVARILYSGNNVLLGHVVGAGKTYTMVAATMELKRLGIARKSLFVVPNHLTEQWGSDFLKLYPNANILVAQKKDFEPLKRKQFISRICSGEYDAVIIGHTQFERIPMSDDYIKGQLDAQAQEISSALSRTRNEPGNRRYSIKQMELELKKVSEKLKTLKLGKKDDVITFEQTGIDYLFVDEAHNYKNCFVHTKMNNVAGVTTSNAQKSFDMLMKTRYISSKNNGNGVVFATGTPISNSMTELFVMQRYLQPDALKKAVISHFDEWASSFGETQTALELKPEGSGYRLRTRFAKFHNLPELINIFTQVADIKVSDDLNLPVPTLATGKPIIEVSPASEFVKSYIDELASRAEAIRDGAVQPYEDNMLKVTSEGKAVAIDARLIDPKAQVESSSKVYKCCDNVFSLYEKFGDEKALQLIFLDTGLPLYQIIKDDLISKGIPQNHIAFIHDAKTDSARAILFEKCRSGEIRVLLGSTQKMGAGTNVQERLIANHHLDCPWRPADIEQRDGRILRQGNGFEEVYIYRYITENTFDAYLWGIQENKQKFITQIMTNKSSARSADDIDNAVLDCAEVKTLATGNPRIKEKMQLDNDVYTLQIEKSAYQKEHNKLQNIIIKSASAISEKRACLQQVNADTNTFNTNQSETFTITINNTKHNERVEAGEKLNLILQTAQPGDIIGNYMGLDLIATKPCFFESTRLAVAGQYHNVIDLGESSLGNITRIENYRETLKNIAINIEQSIATLESSLADARQAVEKPFAKEAELKEKLQSQAKLNIEMELEQQSDIVIMDDEGDTTSSKLAIPQSRCLDDNDNENSL